MEYNKIHFYQGKKVSLDSSSFNNGDVVKVIKVRPKRRKYTSNKNNSKLFIVKKESADFSINNKTIYDNLNLFCTKAFPVMIDIFIEKFENQFVMNKEEKKAVKALTELKDFLKEHHDVFDNIDFSQESKEKCNEVIERSKKIWGKFDKPLPQFW